MAQDERLRNTPVAGDKEQNTQAPDRADRSSHEAASNADGRSNRATERRETNDSKLAEDPVRAEDFNLTLLNEVLPDLPEIPGYHVCWLSTTSQYDVINNRMRLGYVPVKPEDVPGFNYLAVKEGEWAGVIACREMVAFKIKTDRYQAIMEHLHHDRPMEDERTIYENLKNNLTDGRGRGMLREVGDGTEGLVQDVQRPVFQP